jgi:hypothetical protein
LICRIKFIKDEKGERCLKENRNQNLDNDDFDDEIEVLDDDRDDDEEYD